MNTVNTEGNSIKGQDGKEASYKLEGLIVKEGDKITEVKVDGTTVTNGTNTTETKANGITIKNKDESSFYKN